MSDDGKPHPLAATIRPCDEAARRALELHQVEGELLRILAPLQHESRVRVLAAVMCMQSDALSKLVIARFTTEGFLARDEDDL